MTKYERHALSLFIFGLIGLILHSYFVISGRLFVEETIWLIFYACLGVTVINLFFPFRLENRLACTEKESFCSYKATAWAFYAFAALLVGGLVVLFPKEPTTLTWDTAGIIFVYAVFSFLAVRSILLFEFLKQTKKTD